MKSYTHPAPRSHVRIVEPLTIYRGGPYDYDGEREELTADEISVLRGLIFETGMPPFSPLRALDMKLERMLPPTLGDAS